VESRDGRSPIAIAAAWASRIMTVALEMVLPAVLGAWIDGKLGTRAVATLIGVVLGMALGLWHLVRLTRPPGTATGHVKPPVTNERQSSQELEP
jgi:hypothetical protein